MTSEAAQTATAGAGSGGKVDVISKQNEIQKVQKGEPWRSQGWD